MILKVRVGLVNKSRKITLPVAVHFVHLAAKELQQIKEGLQVKIQLSYAGIVLLILRLNVTYFMKICRCFLGDCILEIHVGKTN